MSHDGDIFFGTYRGQVVDNVDPLQAGRIRMQVPEIFGESEVTDWAFPKNNVIFGMVFVPAIGQRVWAEFEAGDPNRPLYSGGWYAVPGGTSEVPELTREIRDITTQDPVGTDQATTGSGVEVNEPQAAHAAMYPLDRVLDLVAGTIEIDDTPGEERLKIFHKSGTYIEFRKDGSVVEKIEGKKHRITIEDDVIHVNGQRIKIVEGNEEITVRGDKTEFIDGELTQTVESEVNRTFEDDVTENYQADRSAIVDGDVLEQISASLQQVIGQSLNQTIGQQHNLMVLQTADEQVGNSGVAVDAKTSVIQLGNYTIKMVAGKWQLKNAAGIVIFEFDSTAAPNTIKIGTNATAIEPMVLGTIFTVLYNGMIADLKSHVHTATGPTSVTTLAQVGPLGGTPLLTPAMTSAEVSTQGFVAP